jgi:hypothetical protein
VEYTSKGEKIERTENGERIFEITYGDIEKVSTMTKDGITTTTFRDVIRTQKFYWGELKPNQYDGPRQATILEFVDK